MGTLHSRQILHAPGAIGVHGCVSPNSALRYSKYIFAEISMSPIHLKFGRNVYVLFRNECNFRCALFK